MGAIKDIAPAPASAETPNFPGFSVENSPLARKLSGRFFCPKEASGFLEQRYGLRVSEKTLRKRCNLPPGHPLHLATNPAFPGRHWIFASELAHLAGSEVAA